MTKTVVEGAGGDTLLTWLLGAAFAILSAAFGFTQKQIADVRREAREDMEAMEATLTERSRESRADRDALWKEIRENQRIMEDQHRRMLERMGQVVTREDMRQDFTQFEQRISQLLQNSENRRQH